MELIIASGNRHKIEEFREIFSHLPYGITLRAASDAGITEDIPETADTLEGNALMKARYIWERTGSSCFADDTGLEVAALGGAPGVHSARYAALFGDAENGGALSHDAQANVTLLLKNLEDKASRRAVFRTVIALILDGTEHLFEGIVEGRIIDSLEGSGGFGYDPIFIPEGYAESFAQMAPTLKNRISHRGLASAALLDFLTTLPRT